MKTITAAFALLSLSGCCDVYDFDPDGKSLRNALMSYTSADSGEAQQFRVDAEVHFSKNGKEMTVVWWEDGSRYEAKWKVAQHR